MARALTQAQCDRARLLSSVHGVQIAAEIMGVSNSTLYRAKLRGWRAADYRSNMRSAPSDFALVAPKLRNREIMQHYRAGPRAVSRWLQEKPVRAPFPKPGRPRREFRA